MPTTETMIPSCVNSNIVNVRPISRPDSSEARMFVDVPISVSMPPNVGAYESAMSSFEGEVSPSWARLVTIGNRMATAAVLLMNSEM